VWVARSEPQFDQDVAAALSECITGVPHRLGTTPPVGLVPFCAQNGPEGDHPWAHLPAEAIERLRWTMWGMYNGAYAPTEHREEALRRAEAVEVSKAAANASLETARARLEDTFGFGGGGDVTEA
jgi:hypothetical protein